MRESCRKRAINIAIAIGLVTVAGVAARVAFLCGASLWWDEFITIGKAQLPFWEMLRSMANLSPSSVGYEFFPPFFHTLLSAALSIEASDQFIKLVPVIFGVLTIPMLYFLGIQ